MPVVPVVPAEAWPAPVTVPARPPARERGPVAPRPAALPSAVTGTSLVSFTLAPIAYDMVVPPRSNTVLSGQA